MKTSPKTRCCLIRGGISLGIGERRGQIQLRQLRRFPGRGVSRLKELLGNRLKEGRGGKIYIYSIYKVYSYHQAIYRAIKIKNLKKWKTKAWE